MSNSLVSFVRRPAMAAVALAVGLAPHLLWAADEVKLNFEQHVRPILKAYCLDCHGGGDELKAKLDLRLRRLLLQGGESGAAIVPGHPEQSVLIHRIRSGEMPPGEKKLPAAELQRLERWIADGALTLRPEPEMIDPGVGITPEEREFWAFQPLRRPVVPPAGASTHPRFRTPIDALIAAAATAAGQGPMSADADRRTLAYRAAFDLTGLAPSAELLEDFLNDAGPDAWERLLDRLVAAPAYGERWGRHWLDLAGYAESDGYTNADTPRPYAYKYRDYVIRALNADKPLDRFLVEQLAGDELVGGATTNFTPEQIELLTATGFLRMAADGTGSGAADQDLARNQVVADTLKIVSTGLLGLSVHCAQCHNHRYDPIPQADYYRLRAVFEPALDWKSWRVPQQRLVSLYTDADRKKAAEIEAEAGKIATEKNQKQAEYLAAALEKELGKFPEPMREPLRVAYNTPADKRSPEQAKLLKENPSVNISPGVLYQYDAKAADDLKKYDERINAVRAGKPVEDFLHALTEPPQHQPPTHLFHRGDHRQPKGTVAPGDLTIATPPGQRFDIPSDDPQIPTTGRRLALARWLTSGTHPLLGRVLANRIWLQHFGRGIVGTPGEFGVLGERPTHPELLDWLATELPRQEWSLKQMHRLLMSSTVYRQSSARDPQRIGQDDDNRYYTRMPVRRLEAEILRDRMLDAAGNLKQRLHGPSVAVKEDDVGQVIVGGDDSRRSVYLQSRRSQPIALLTAFDAPVMETNCDRRISSTVATQSLILMNGEFTLKQAADLAQRVRRAAAVDTTGGIPTDPSQAESARRIREWATQAENRRATSAWQYGSGGFDDATQRVVHFQPLPYWTGSSWQGSAQLPDAKIGWTIVHAHGGHTGENPRYAAVRRWIAPRSGAVTLRGRLEHPSENGDGVRGRIVSSRSGLAGEWSVKQGGADTVVADLRVETGDTIDLVVDCREHVTSDSFAWTVELTLSGGAGEGRTRWNSATDFHGPPGPALAAQVRAAWQFAFGRAPRDSEYELALGHFARQLEQLQAHPPADANSPGAKDPELLVLTNLCQVLLTSNEFLYVD